MSADLRVVRMFAVPQWRTRLRNRVLMGTFRAGRRSLEAQQNVFHHDPQGRALRDGPKRLSRADRAQEREAPAARIAHDFRNLLTAILGCVDLATDDLPEGHPVHKRLRMIEEVVRRGANLTDSLAGLAHGDASEGVPPPGEDAQVCAELSTRRVTSTKPKPACGALRERKRGSGELILLVEGDDHIRAILTSTLQARGYQPVPVARGAEAAEVLNGRRAAVCLVVLDLDSPGKNGLSWLGDLRRTRSDLPMIVVTDHAGLEPAGGLGAGDVLLRKPFRTTDLEELVADVLARSGSEGTVRCRTPR